MGDVYHHNGAILMVVARLVTRQPWRRGQVGDHWIMCDIDPGHSTGAVPWPPPWP